MGKSRAPCPMLYQGCCNDKPASAWCNRESSGVAGLDATSNYCLRNSGMFRTGCSGTIRRTLYIPSSSLPGKHKYDMMMVVFDITDHEQLSYYAAMHYKYRQRGSSPDDTARRRCTLPISLETVSENLLTKPGSGAACSKGMMRNSRPLWRVCTTLHSSISNVIYVTVS